MSEPKLLELETLEWVVLSGKGEAGTNVTLGRRDLLS